MRGNSKTLSNLTSNVIDRTFEQRLTLREAEREREYQVRRAAHDQEDMLVELFRKLPQSAQTYVVAVVKYEHDRFRE